MYISLPSLHDYDVKMPNFTFFGRRKQATTNFSLFLKLSVVAKKSTPGKFAYKHLAFQRIDINATAFDEKRINSDDNSDVCAAVAAVNAKAASCKNS